MKAMHLSSLLKVKFVFFTINQIQSATFLSCFLLISFFTNAQSLLNRANAITIHPDTTVKSFASKRVVDSSKIFLNLLASDNNQSIVHYSMNPEVKLFADDYIRTHTNYFNNMKVWGKPYFDLYDHILSSYGVPVQLKYLSVIESSLSSNAVSWAGAVGPWQIMEDAAQQHGLRTGNYDDRLDYVKSTNVAAQILKNLYAKYKDWLLVIAAYNCGEANVDRAITKAQSNNFWNIQYYLPEETRNHVKKFIATHYYFEGDGSIVTMTADEAKNFIADTPTIKNDSFASIAANATTINIYGKYNSAVIANALTIDINLFNQLNPNMDIVLAKGDIYPLRLPADKAEFFQSKKSEILKQSVELFLNAANSTTTNK
ncbi:MAG TPA: lytic transglycosylase domain-containing protein [Parafilimonas sp.]|nr:lytic transglycosylase domain-containing protein [Parafilimonas sp.]